MNLTIKSKNLQRELNFSRIAAISASTVTRSTTSNKQIGELEMEQNKPDWKRIEKLITENEHADDVQEISHRARQAHAEGWGDIEQYITDAYAAGSNVAGIFECDGCGKMLDDPGVISGSDSVFCDDGDYYCTECYLDRQRDLKQDE